MKTSDSDLKVNRNIYPDAVRCDRVRLIGPKCDQLGPITTVYLKSPNEKTNPFNLFPHTHYPCDSDMIEYEISSHVLHPVILRVQSCHP